MHIFHQQFNMIQYQICSTERKSSTLGKYAGQTMFHACLERVKVLVLKSSFKKCKLSHKGAADTVKYFPSLKSTLSFTSLHPLWKENPLSHISAVQKTPEEASLRRRKLLLDHNAGVD